MTYTYKLARRLAMLREFSMLSLLAALAACTVGEATSPEAASTPASWRPRSHHPVSFSVSPSSVTVETDQPVRFTGVARSAAGDTLPIDIVWSATGGSMSSDGLFTSSTVGTFRVVGRWVGREHGDSSTVVVVPPQPTLASLAITPAVVSLAPGGGQAFQAAARLSDGSSATVGIVWTASGGEIDAAGAYVAPQAAGTYQVIAASATGSVADTAAVTVEVPPPTLTALELTPASAALPVGATRRFAAHGRLSNGDSVDVPVTFSATGGTITATGLYTAGGRTGTYRVIARHAGGAMADTASVTVTPDAGIVTTPLPVGSWHAPTQLLGARFSGATLNGDPATMRRSLDSVRAAQASVTLSVRRANMRDVNGLSFVKFREEIARWRAAMPELGGYFTDGTVIAIVVMDDFQSIDTWGHVVTPAEMDELARIVKAAWPEARTVVRARPGQLGDHIFQYLGLAWAQYNGPYRDGRPEDYARRNIADAQARRLGLLLGLNVLDGGCGPTTACVVDPATGDTVRGTSRLGTYIDAARVRRYQMSAEELRYYGRVFATLPENCALLGWRWSESYPRASGHTEEQYADIRAFDTRPDVVAAWQELVALGQRRTRGPCGR